MYKKILAAVNEHLNSEIAARYALNLAKACEAKLYLSFIAESGLSRSDIESAEKAMKRLFLEAEVTGLPVESIAETGNIFQQIERTVRREGIDLVFASTRREDVEKRFYVGTEARTLSVRLPCSVALVRVVHAGKLHPSRILVPLKARIEHGKERAFFIARLAEAFHARLLLFHAPKPMTKLFHGEIHLKPLEWEQRLPKDFSDLMGYVEDYGVPLQRRIAPGAVGKSIVVEAASQRQDLIIMGASQRRLLGSFLKGNPVEELLRQTPCNLIILKPVHEGS
ncbi:MAG: universal stress protein [Acidobacteria bacterium]|nr:universal stress protein [Acidobacteriota bacterium]